MDLNRVSRYLADNARVAGVTMLGPAFLPWLLVFDSNWRRWAAWSPLIVAVAVSIGTSPSLAGVIGLAALLCALCVRPAERFSGDFTLFLVAGSVLLDFSTGRPAGLFKNALSAGEALSLFAVARNSPWLAFVAGFTGSRTPLLIAALSPHGRFTLRPQLYLMVGGAVVLGLLAWAGLHGFERFTPGAVATAGELRGETYSNPGGLFGSGYGAYQGQRPHNVFISLWAQMGLLSVPVWLTVAWHARRLPWRLFLPLIPPAFLNDWIVSTPGGLLCVSLYIALAYEKQRRPDRRKKPQSDQSPTIGADLAGVL